ncbi:MAG: hypothetical protein COB15_09770 [Flavobacteriales bacterium]|nr:MAG: hypothetical protein COB15_09770 [Flavobacteriales bacterium]
MKFPFYKQPDEMDCGATCIRMIAKNYGRSISLPKLRSLSETTREGASLKNRADAAEKIEICKDCEYRYCCTDCRVFTDDRNNN